MERRTVGTHKKEDLSSHLSHSRLSVSKSTACTDATQSNDCCITHFNSCQHSKIAQEQKLEILYVLYYSSHIFFSKG